MRGFIKNERVLIVNKIIVLLICIFSASACSTNESEGLECYISYMNNGDQHSLLCAKDYFQKRVKNNNHVDDKLKLGNLYFHSNDVDKAIKLYEEVRASSNSGDASYNLAKAYYSGDTKNKNFAKVEMYLKEASVAGIAQAQLELSFMYSTHVKNKDYKKAIKYLTDAANNKTKDDDGYVDEAVIKAQLLLGKIYMDGLWGREKNKSKATRWMREASDNIADKSYK